MFQNTFTYKGERRLVRKWLVKFQIRGRRSTFSLHSHRRAAAAVEACALYRHLFESGSEGATRRPIPGTTQTDRLQPEYWRQSLVHRDYTSDLHPDAPRWLSIRIEHAGARHYFPLSTPDIATAERKALEIYRAVLAHGWNVVNQRYPRELTVAFHWTDHPLAWTYSTIYTRVAAAPGPFPAAASPLKVAVVESDPGVRQALRWCLDSQPGVSCAAMFGTCAEALRALAPGAAHLVLTSQRLADEGGAACLQQILARMPDAYGVVYSVHEDSEELFKTTPGGAGSYLLRRTRPIQLLEPLGFCIQAGDCSRDQIRNSVWQYFKDTFASLPLAGSAPRLNQLTQREHEVLGLLSEGHPDKEIAERLRISIWTVHGHVRNILEKLGVHNRTGAVGKYLQK